MDAIASIAKNRCFRERCPYETLYKVAPLQRSCRIRCVKMELQADYWCRRDKRLSANFSSLIDW